MQWASALPRFEGHRLRAGRAIVERGRYLGAYMQAQTGPEPQRREAEQARVPEKAMMEMAAPLNFG